MKKYLEIYENIKRLILSGEIKAGEKLPSKRNMAYETGYSVITVEKAYGMLYEEGFITTRERSGYIVSEIDVITTSELVPMPLAVINDEVKFDEFEYNLWFKTVRKVISEYDKELFIKADNKGCAILRNAISKYLYKNRNMLVPPQRIIVGSGAEQLYENVVKIFSREKIVGIEDPSYSRIEEVYLGEGAVVEKLKMGVDGILSDELKKKFDILHVTPHNSYPSGVTATLEKKNEYLEWAKKGDKYIVEDDFAGEFYAPGFSLKTIYSMSTNDDVIYINTFSKSLSPSMRIGYMVLPEKLMDKYDKILGKYSCSVPVLDQYVLAEFLDSGNFERHLNKVRRKLMKKSN